MNRRNSPRSLRFSEHPLPGPSRRLRIERLTLQDLTDPWPRNSLFHETSWSYFTSSKFFNSLVAPYECLPLDDTSEIPVDFTGTLQPSAVVRQSGDTTGLDSDWPTPGAGPNPRFIQSIYRPIGTWAWADGLPITSSADGIPVSQERSITTSIKISQINGRKISYISKSWSTSAKLNSFFSEVALYKVQLQSLQGSVVPEVIGVYASPGKVTLSMGPPHHVFWIEASPDMPDALKERCVEAFKKLHACGVLHGNVELKNILIGGDAKITLINLHKGRALVANEVVHLAGATPAELKLEMRKVKFMLNHRDAREQVEIESIRPTRLPQRKQQGSEAALEGSELEWIDYQYARKQEPLSFCPRRFVMPGQTVKDLEEGVNRFLALVQSMGVNEPMNTHATPPSPPTRDGRLADPHLNGQLGVGPPRGQYPLRDRGGSTPSKIDGEDDMSLRGIRPSRPTFHKRKNAVDLSSGRPAKRYRGNMEPTYADIHGPGHKSSVKQPLPSHFGSPAASGTLRTTTSMHNILDDRPTDSYVTPATTSAFAGSRFPPVKVRDFAYELQPLTSKRIIVDTNVRRCAELGLPHPDAIRLDPDNPRWKDADIEEYIRQHNVRSHEAARLARLYPNRNISLPRLKRGAGSLKRAMEKIVQRSEALETKIPREGDQPASTQGKRKREDELGEVDRYLTSSDAGSSDLRQAPKILKTLGGAALDAASFWDVPPSLKTTSILGKDSGRRLSRVTFASTTDYVTDGHRGSTKRCDTLGNTPDQRDRLSTPSPGLLRYRQESSIKSAMASPRLPPGLAIDKHDKFSRLWTTEPQYKDIEAFNHRPRNHSHDAAFVPEAQPQSYRFFSPTSSDEELEVEHALIP